MKICPHCAVGSESTQQLTGFCVISGALDGDGERPRDTTRKQDRQVGESGPRKAELAPHAQQVGSFYFHSFFFFPSNSETKTWKHCRSVRELKCKRQTHSAANATHIFDY